MKTAICELLGIDLPLVAFSHCRDVVAEVTKSGGCGVLGAALMSPEELDAELSWIDEQVKGRPYGVDLIVPNSFEGKGGAAPASPTTAYIPADVISYVADILRDHDMDPDEVPPPVMASAETMSEAYAADMVEVALKHKIGLIANALGTPPVSMLAAAQAAGVPVGALVGTARHAEVQAAAGVDFIVASGSEAGGHTGDISTMVLVPEVVQRLAEIGSPVPVLAAGGIVTGRQVAAALALGAAGVWTGSVWLTTYEAETAEYTKAKMLAASSSDTVRSRFRTGKPSRQLRSTWHDAWEREGAPAALPMPVMGYVSEPPLRRADVLAVTGHEGARRLSSYWVGQGVGLMRTSKPVKQVVADLMDGLIEGYECLTEALGD